MLLSMLAACLGFSLTAFPSDTPPAPIPPPPVTQLRTARDIIAASRLINGAVPPSTIVMPTMINRDSLMDFINERYPESAAAEPEAPFAWVYVNEQGEAHVAGIMKSTRDAALDSLAIATARQARFKPAMLGNVPVALWAPVRVELSRPAPPGEKFLPYTKKPQLLNRDYIGRGLAQNYPPSLQRMRIGGTVLLWILIDERGKVVRTKVKESAGHPEFDSVAEGLALGMIFAPAENRGRHVPVWVQIPIVFKTQTQVTPR